MRWEVSELGVRGRLSHPPRVINARKNHPWRVIDSHPILHAMIGLSSEESTAAVLS